MSKTVIKLGDQYGSLKIIAPNTDKTYKQYDCLCLSCGNKCTLRGQDILKLKMCRPCYAKNKANRNRYRDMVGKTYNNITVLDISTNRGNNGATVLSCRCLLCDSVFETYASRIKLTNMQSCAKCSRQKSLPIGWDITKDTQVDGTRVICINRKSKNKNNTTGVKGVAKTGDGSKYRAYINFRRKQYHLGIYDTLDDAAKARATAEKEIYGNFLEWYKSEYPDKYEKYIRK